MDNDVEKVISRIKEKRSNSIDNKKNRCLSYFKMLIARVLICVILTLSSLIYVNYSQTNLKHFSNVVYEEYLDFSKYNSFYTKYLGSILPFEKIVDEKVETVFNEKFYYQDQSSYLNGYELKVDENYLVPVIQTGVVVFVGEKENYGKTIIIEGMDGIDIWYGNLNNMNLELYDYVLKGSLLGDIVGNKIFITFIKDDKYLSFEEYAI